MCCIVQLFAHIFASSTSRLNKQSKFKTTIKKTNKMKTTKMNIKNQVASSVMNGQKSVSKFVMLGLLILATTFGATAGTLKNKTSKDKEVSEIRTQLFDQIQFPSFLIDKNTKEENVTVTFKIENDGSVKVMKTNSENKELNNYITEKLNSAKIESLQTNNDNLYQINIRFKLL